MSFYFLNLVMLRPPGLLLGIYHQGYYWGYTTRAIIGDIPPGLLLGLYPQGYYWGYTPRAIIGDIPQGYY